MKQTVIFGYVCCVGICLTASAGALRNGGFEDTQDGKPSEWIFATANGCQGTMVLDTETKVEGRQSIRLSSASELEPHHYCGLAQQIGPLEPNRTHHVTFRAKGEDVGTCWFGGGPGWDARGSFPQGSFDWQVFDFAFDPGTADTFEFRINVDSVTKSLWIDDVRFVTGPDPAEVSSEAIALIAQQELRLPKLHEMLEAARKDGLPVFYPESDLTIAEMFCQYCRDDAANARYERALEVAHGVTTLLDRAEAEMRRAVDVPVVDVGSVTIHDGSFWGRCRLAAGEEERPVFLTGYGHFPPVVDALPVFKKIGINVIQIEIGPRSVVLEDGVNTDSIQSYVIHALDLARDNGVAVCLLISPHYFPDWAFKKWPEIRVENGFLNNSLDAPQVREVYERFLRTLIPMIKDHPALNSICLSNEPVSLGSAEDPFRLPLWHAYITKKYGTIEALNALYGTTYASFDEVPHPKLAFTEAKAPLYDVVRFNQERFAEWHAWMAGIIHEMAPDLPCHAKVMALPLSRDTTFWGTDPWQFAELSQINGNDCYFLPRYEAPWESRWDTQNMYYDLQRSMKRVPIFNTENHIIRDREKGYVSGEHIYTAIWQGAIHGQGGSTTWAWQRTYDEKADFEGLILHRPLCTAAMSRCALDLMRLSREVAALQNAAPRVALLYSHAATLAEPRHCGHREDAYDALNFCGVPLGFITDAQIEAGQLAQYDCLIVPGAKAASRAAIEGIRSYAAGGGYAIAIGPDNLVQDEYGRAIDPPDFSATIDRAKGQELRDTLARELARAGIKPAVVLREAGGKALPFGVEWRSVEQDGVPVVNLVNLTREPIEVRLPKGHWTDLISGTEMPETVALKTNTPVLAKRLGK